MRIPVFVSCPTALNPEQERSRAAISDLLDDLELEPRTLGRGDWATSSPLREIFVLAKHCSGGLILGFEQLCIESGVRKRGCPDDEEAVKEDVLLPTPWNNLEAGILYGMKLPLLVFKEDGIEGGIFDLGASDIFINVLPAGQPSKEEREVLRSILLKWQAQVRDYYYQY